jgi:hypothetical protein
MPIEIRELVIRATVTEAAAREPVLAAALARMQQQVLQQCLERLREELERGMER